MSEKYSLNEIAYSFIASYMWGGGAQKRPKQYDVMNDRPLIETTVHVEIMQISEISSQTLSYLCMY